MSLYSNSKHLLKFLMKGYYTYKETISGSTWYYDSDGDLHRLDGPAVEYADGTKEYWVHGWALGEKTYNSKCKDGVYQLSIEDLP